MTERIASMPGGRRGAVVSLLCAVLAFWATARPCVAEPEATADPAETALLREGGEALMAWRVGDARRCAEELLGRRRDNPAALALAAQTEFMAGDYAESRRYLAAARRLGVEPPGGLAQALGTLRPVHDSFQERDERHFRFRWSNPTDAVLASYAHDVLEKALDAVGRELGYRHEGKIVVEVYPDLESFSAASTLTLDEVRTTAVVAIAKFNRLMIASPRLYLQGYRWCDTLAHELTHYVIIKKTDNRVPVWLHEGLAKFCETLWRRPADQVVLTPMQQTLLAEAREAERFITFEQMHPSLAKLDSQEDAALAYAEVVSFVHYLRRLKGPSVLSDLLGRVADGRAVPEALRDETGMSLAQLHEAWLKSVREADLERVPGLKVMEMRPGDGADNSERASDLADAMPRDAYYFARLGDMLRDQARPHAAAIEYGKALDRTGAVSPHLSVRLARAQVLAGAYKDAEATLDKAAVYYEGYLPVHIVRGELYSALGEPERAAASLEEAVRINPFDPRPHEALVGLYGRLGRPAEQARAEEALAIIYQWLRL